MGHSVHQPFSQCGFAQRGFDFTRSKIIKYMGKNLPNAENFKYMRMNAGGYSLNHWVNWNHQLPKHCKCLVYKNVRVLSDEVWTGSISVRVHATLFSHNKFAQRGFGQRAVITRCTRDLCAICHARSG
jgi:hypothetical protein